MSFRKIRFCGRGGATAGLVVDCAKTDFQNVAELSRLYPFTEADRMERLYVSPEFKSWEGAFRFSFDDDERYTGA